MSMGIKSEVLDLGDTFAFETHNGRRGIGRVNALAYPQGDAYSPERPYHVRWDDASGKHYEWFSLDEFKVLIRL